MSERTLRLTLVASAFLALSPALATAQSGSRAPEVLASADEAWNAGKYEDAFVRYQDVLRRDSTSARAVFRVATLLAWRNDLDRSVSLFRLYVRIAPGDEDGRIGLARALAWAGHYDQSIALCDSVLAANPRQRDAALLAAQAVAWSGSLRGAIVRYERWLSSHPNDTEALTGLAQVWRWAGRAEETRQASQRAVDADPRNANARNQLEWANAALAASLEPTVATTDDSDDNRSTTFTVRSGFAAPWSARVLADGSYRVADLGTRHGTAATVRASSSWSPFDGQWTVRGELGAARLDGSDAPGATHATHLEPIVAARLSGRLTPRLSLGGGVTRAAFDETAALILAGIATTGIDADADFSIRPRLTLGGGAGWTRLSGGSGPNSRIAASGVLRYSLTKFVSIAAGGRGFGYEHAAFDGYFAPKRYLLAEVSSRLRLGGELGWGVESDVGLGNQTITAFDNSRAGRFAQRFSAGVAYRPAIGVEWSLSGGFANVASPTTISSADYRAYNIALKGRVRL
jgi:tetratricopeptide (TPR) repeat protein